MNQPMRHEPNPRLDLTLDRIVDVPKELVWRAWTEPELLMQWFCPLPWRTTACEIDLRPGGVFSSVMEGPDGERHESEGCFLEVVKNEKLVWTSCLSRGYRPNMGSTADDCTALHMTVVVTMEDFEGGTKYRALAIHGNEASQKQHAEMGFNEGWGAACEQMVAMLKKM